MSTRYEEIEQELLSLMIQVGALREERRALSVAACKHEFYKQVDNYTGGPFYRCALCSAREVDCVSDKTSFKVDKEGRQVVE